jgi:xylulokinase
MNLMSIHSGQWDDQLLEACGGLQLDEKLGGDPVVGGTALGKVSQWWVKRYGFNEGMLSV